MSDSAVRAAIDTIIDLTGQSSPLLNPAVKMDVDTGHDNADDGNTDISIKTQVSSPQPSLLNECDDDMQREQTIQEEQPAVNEAPARSKSNRESPNDKAGSYQNMITASFKEVRAAEDEAKQRRREAHFEVKEAELIFTAAEATCKQIQAEITGINDVVRARGIERLVESHRSVTRASPATLATSRPVDCSKASAKEIYGLLNSARRRSKAAHAAKKTAEINLAAKKAMEQIARAQEEGLRAIMKARDIDTLETLAQRAKLANQSRAYTRRARGRR